MKIQNKIIIFIFIIILIYSIPLSAKKRPEWVKNRPVDKNYYIGIGIASKTGDNRDYIQLAKDDALKNLASEIVVNISSEVISTVIEKSGVLEEELRSRIQSSTQAELEDYELIGTWEDKKEYWVYYRLSKEFYKINKIKKIEKAVSLSMDMFKEAKNNEKNKNIEKALLYYLQSLKPIEKYIGEPLETSYAGRDIYLNNEIYFSIQSLLSDIELKPGVASVNGKINKSLKKPLEFIAIYQSRNGSKVNIYNLPLRYSFLKGSGELIVKSRTNYEGKGKTTVSKITSSDKMQIVKAEVDIYSFINQDSASFIYQNILKSFPIPNTKIILNVSGLSIYVESDEKNFGQKIGVKYIEPKIKEQLSEYGYSFSDDLTNADIYITVKANSREGSFMYNMYSAFVDLTISAIDMSTGEEVYKTTLSKVKGLDLDNSKAGLKALDNAAEKVCNEILPDLVKKF